MASPYGNQGRAKSESEAVLRLRIEEELADKHFREVRNLDYKIHALVQGLQSATELIRSKLEIRTEEQDHAAYWPGDSLGGVIDFLRYGHVAVAMANHANILMRPRRDRDYAHVIIIGSGYHSYGSILNYMCSAHRLRVRITTIDENINSIGPDGGRHDPDAHQIIGCPRSYANYGQYDAILMPTHMFSSSWSTPIVRAVSEQMSPGAIFCGSLINSTINNDRGRQYPLQRFIDSDFGRPSLYFTKGVDEETFQKLIAYLKQVSNRSYAAF